MRPYWRAALVITASSTFSSGTLASSWPASLASLAPPAPPSQPGPAACGYNYAGCLRPPPSSSFVSGAAAAGMHG